MKKYKRYILYAIGIITLALGLSLNTKASLGTSPIISIAFSISQKYNLNLGDITLIEYSIFVFIEMIIHHISKEKKSVFIMDILQVPFSIVFTRFLNIFNNHINSFADSSIINRIGVLVIAIILTGIGAALTLNVKLIPNPGDGIVQTIAKYLKKETGLIKNYFDLTCIIITVLFCLLTNTKIISVGVGTIIAMLFTGRVIYLFNKYVNLNLD